MRRLAKENYKVCVNDIAACSSNIDSLVSDINAQYGRGTAIGVIADVTKQSQVQSMIKAATENLGPLTMMIANAGKWRCRFDRTYHHSPCGHLTKFHAPYRLPIHRLIAPFMTPTRDRTC